MVGNTVYFQWLEPCFERDIRKFMLSFDELKERLADFSERGVVMRDGIGMSLRDLYDERLPLYEKYADITVDVNDLSITAAARKVAHALK